MNFTLDDMSADALGVGGGSVNLSTQESAKTVCIFRQATVITSIVKFY